MSASQLLDLIVARVPGFAVAWESPENCFRYDSGAFTTHGVFAAFSDFFRENYERFSPVQLADVGVLITESVLSETAEIADAAATCFLENLQGERFSADFRQHLRGKALRLYSL